MGMKYVPIVLATMCSLLTMTRASVPTLNSVTSFTSSVADSTVGNINIADTYSIRNTINIHSDCHRWCWLQVRAKSIEECYNKKRIGCEKLKNFSYKFFIAFQLSKLGMGKFASTVMGVPGEVISAGLQASVFAVGAGGAALVQGAGQVGKAGELVGTKTVETVNIVGDNFKSVGSNVAGLGQQGAQKMGQSVSKLTAAPSKVFGGLLGN